MECNPEAPQQIPQFSLLPGCTTSVLIDTTHKKIIIIFLKTKPKNQKSEKTKKPKTKNKTNKKKLKLKS